MSDDRYPDISEDTDSEWAQMIALLEEADDSHFHKAVALTCMARTEFAFAYENGELPAEATFGEFADDVDHAVDEKWGDVEHE